MLVSIGNFFFLKVETGRIALLFIFTIPVSRLGLYA